VSLAYAVAAATGAAVALRVRDGALATMVVAIAAYVLIVTIAWMLMHRRYPHVTAPPNVVVGI
jgi:hypothetical protein